MFDAIDKFAKAKINSDNYRRSLAMKWNEMECNVSTFWQHECDDEVHKATECICVLFMRMIEMYASRTSSMTC